MFRYKFQVKDWKTRKFSTISKIFNKELSIDEIRNELSVLFDTGYYKNVMVNYAEQLDELGNVIKKIDLRKW